MITPKRSRRIKRFLARGGAINKVGDRYELHHPEGSFVVTADEVTDLFNVGALAVINCGCTGFWWALRPDLIAEEIGVQKETP